MPISPSHPCSKSGCVELLPRGTRYCEEHQREINRDYDEHHRPEHHALYHTTRWRRIRAAHLVEHPFCVECDQLANTVDHIKEHEGDKSLFYSADNLQSLCAACHNRKHPRGWAG